MYDEQCDVVDLLDQSIVCLLTSHLFGMVTTNTDEVIQAFKDIPGMRVQISEVLKDESAPDIPDNILIVSDYKKFLTFGCILEFSEIGWHCKEIFHQTVTQDAYDMLEFVFGMEMALEDAQDSLTLLSEMYYTDDLFDGLPGDDDDDGPLLM